MEFLSDLLAWFTDPTNWQGVDGVPNRTWEHIQMTVFSTGVAAVFAIPPAVVLAHRRLGAVLVVAAVNIGRAVPSFAIVAIFLPISIRLGLGLGFWPTFLALFFLAVPPMFSNTYTGIAGVEPALVEASRGMGMTERQIMIRIETPMAMPIIIAGVRVAVVQVIATATLGALVAWGGLGRYIIDGFSVQDLAEVAAGGILVALLAVGAEIAFSALERRVTPKGVTIEEPIGTAT